MHPLDFWAQGRSTAVYNHLDVFRTWAAGIDQTPYLPQGCVTFADSYLTVNIEFRNKACTLGKYYSYTEACTCSCESVRVSAILRQTNSSFFRQTEIKVLKMKERQLRLVPKLELNT